ncbi:hypothetical protein [Synechococcus sp. UW179A]|nr:hypothetical protein [Synechococcus sp. UW179A]
MSSSQNIEVTSRSKQKKVFHAFKAALNINAPASYQLALTLIVIEHS